MIFSPTSQRSYHFHLRFPKTVTEKYVVSLTRISRLFCDVVHKQAPLANVPTWTICLCINKNTITRIIKTVLVLVCAIGAATAAPAEVFTRCEPKPCPMGTICDSVTNTCQVRHNPSDLDAGTKDGGRDIVPRGAISPGSSLLMYSLAATLK